MDVLCSNTQSCYRMGVIPSNGDGKDLITLKCGGSESCHLLHITETNAVALNYLNLVCLESSCITSNITTSCYINGAFKYLWFKYVEAINEWECSDFNNPCCPFPIPNNTLTPTSVPTSSSIDVFNMTLIDKAGKALNPPSINVAGPMFITCMIVAMIDFFIIIFLIRYIIKYLLPRAQKPGNVTIIDAIKTLYWYQYIFICLEIFDVVTDYLYGASLIQSGDNELFILGWLALLFGIFGVIMFIIKYSSWRKLFAYQVTDYKSQLKKYSSETHFDNDKCNEIVGEIRTRTLDIDVLAALNTCLEDVPSTLIVLISSIKFEWDAIAVLSISLSILSFVLKLCQLIVTQFGCKDYNKYQPGTSMATRSVGYSIAMSLNMNDTNSPSSPSSNNDNKPSLHKSVASHSNNIHTVQ